MRGRTMENDVKGWLTFTAKVEKELQSINLEIFSDVYKSKLLALLYEIRREEAGFSSLNMTQKQERYLKINSLAKDLRLTAYFVN